MSDFNAKLKEILDRQSSNQPTTDNSASLTEINSFGDKTSILSMFDDIKAYNRMLAEKITFINDDLTNVIPFTRENLYLICGYTGNGKSTIAANISYPLWKQKKKTLVIANEESKTDVLMRIACIELGYNYNTYKKGFMPAEHQKKCAMLFPDIAQYVKVMDVAYKDGITTRLEGIINALEAVKSADFSCVMIDYYQNINKSDKLDKKYYILDQLKTYLIRYIKTSNIPVVLFAQLHSLGKRNNVELDSRIKDAPQIIEASTVVIEVIPDFEQQKTDFIIKKDRFGYQGKKVCLGFDGGRFVRYDDAFKNKYITNKLNSLTTNNAEVPDDKVV